MRFFVTERTCHAAATGRDDVHNGVRRKPQQFCGLFHTHQGFLMAMSVQPYLYLHVAEPVASDSSGTHLTHQELIEKERIASQFLRCRLHFGCYQIRVLVAESEDTRRLDTHQRRVLCNKVFEQAYVLVGVLLREPQTAFRDRRPTALHMLGDDDIVSEPREQINESLHQFGFVVAGKFIEEKEDLFRCTI